MANKMTAQAQNELVLDEQDEKILDGVWADFRNKNPGFRSSPKERQRLAALSETRAAIYASVPSLEERTRARKQRRTNDQ